MSRLTSRTSLLKICVLVNAVFMVALSFGVAFAQRGDTGDAAAAAFTGVTALISLACGLIFFVISVVSAIWVYTDAQKRQANGCLWAIVAFLLSFPIGLILYILLRPKTTMA